MLSFDEFFRQATGHMPYGFQRRIARDGLPDVVRAPTGTGKTGVILAWLWRRLHGPAPEGTARRLVLALPRWAVVDHAAGEVRGWLTRLGLSDTVALHVVLGSRGENLGDWREDMHRPAVIVGTADYLVSRALNSGFGIGRAFTPIDFGLLTNGAQWIIDEPRLSPQSTATLRRLTGFAAGYGTAEPCALTCLSSVETKGTPERGRRVEILPEERDGELAVRLGAARTFHRLDVEPGDYRSLAAAAAERHRPGTLTVVALNTMRAAREVYRELRAGQRDCTLWHSWFRGVERASLTTDVINRPDDRIVVTTQVMEAGTDLNAALLITEAAPWPSLMLRAGRCNRTGRVHPAPTVLWVPPPDAAPHEGKDIQAAVAELGRIEGQWLTSTDFSAREVPSTDPQVVLLGQAEFAALFDTTPTPDVEVDVAPFVRDGTDLDVEVAWATWTPGEDGAPHPDVRWPAPEYRCRIPIGEAVAFAADRVVWRLDQLTGGWTRLTGQPGARPRPGELLLVDGRLGGYTRETGFDPAARGPVSDSPVLLTPDEQAEQAAQAAALSAVADGADAPPPRSWQSLDEHSEQVRDQAAALINVLAPDVPPDAARSVVVAGYLHDVGKAHPIWQDALCALAEDEERAEVSAGRPWAKSGGKGGRLEFSGGVAFRHELASLALLDGPLRELLAEAPDQDLARFLVLAHHGRLRVQVGDPDGAGGPGGPPAGESPDFAIRGLVQGAVTSIPPMLGRPASTLTVDLRQFRPGDGSWTSVVRGILARYGPVKLAYMEALVRVADWRASGGRDLPR